MFKGLIPLALILIPLFLSLFFGLAVLIVGPFATKNIFFILFFSLVFSIFEFLRGKFIYGISLEFNFIYLVMVNRSPYKYYHLIGAYSLSLISDNFFLHTFSFFSKKIVKKNIFFILIFLIIFVGNYSYGLHLNLTIAIISLMKKSVLK